MWSEKHRPRTAAEMVGNEEPRAAVMEWFAKWRKGTRPIMLVGPPGTGKTTIAHVAAGRFGYDLIGLNASDARSRSRINDVLAPALGNASVMGSPMIFVDEVDGIHGRSDYGGAAALAEILKAPAVPVVLAANDDSSDKMRAISRRVTTVRLRRVPPRLLRTHLEDVLRREGARLGPGTLVAVVNRSRGDIRSMINMAQALATGFGPQSEPSFERVDVEEGVNAFFGANSPEEARGVLHAMRTDPREKIGAFYSSVVTSDRLDPAARARCLRAVSDADVLYGRIMRTQDWRLLRYLDDTLMGLYAGGGRSDDGGKGVRYSRYGLSWPLLNRIRWDGAKLRGLASEMARRLHASSSAAAASCLPCALTCIANGTLEMGPREEEEFGDAVRKEIEATYK